MRLARISLKALNSLAGRFADARYVLSRSKKFIPIRYYDKKLNVGDSLNPYLISRLAGKKVYKVRSSLLPHVLGVGSVVHLASSKSIIWGSGVIDPDILPTLDVLLKINVIALRGEKTKQLLAEKGVMVEGSLLGDPAVLMPHVYQPVAIQKKYLIGVVPHLVDKKSSVIKKLTERPDVTLIDVADSPEKFVQNICECQYVMSSSLHGLILSDSYSIPNIWANFSDRIIGGDFKFLDYYSTTDNKNPKRLSVDANDDFDEVINRMINDSRVNSFLFDKFELASSLPSGL